MRLFYVLLCTALLCASTIVKANSNDPGKVTLTGTITDKKTGESLPGVNIYLPDLKTGAVTDINGHYSISDLPATTVLVEIHFVGYQVVSKQIDLSKVTSLDVSLSETATEMNEVVVTGQNKATELRRTPAPITTIRPEELQQEAASNIISKLAEQPGISAITTGPGISKPVIRGLGYNRVVTIKDGIRQEGQQWGDEHGIEVDDYAINRVEVLKGPASLTYGSDAMAGVINLLEPEPLPEGQIKGSVLANYQTNNGMIGYSADIAGNRKGFIWNARFSQKRAHAYQNRYDGYVFNSGFQESAANATIGLNKNWGYSHLHLSAFSLTPGIVEGERDSATGAFLKPISINGQESTALATHSDFMSYTPQVPYQHVHHYKAVLDNSIVMGDGLLKATFGLQQNQRQEFADITKPNQYGLYFLLNTFNYDVRYNAPDKNGLSLSVGVNGMAQQSQNKGTEFLVPAYHLFDFGGFVMAKKTWGNLDISGGARYDTRNEHGDDLFLNAAGQPVGNPNDASTHRFSAFHSIYSGFSGSLGATYQISEKVYTKLNLSRGFRAPNIGEIGSNGVHDGTVRYEIGNPNLQPEHSLQLDYALGVTSNHVKAEMDLFTNTIDNFIFTRKLSSVFGGDSLRDGLQTFAYVSGTARLSGGELSIDVHPHPLDWLHFKNGFSYVYSVQLNQPDSMKYLPFTPAPKWTSELKASAKKLGKHLSNAYISVGVNTYFAQNHYYSAFGTETATPGYSLLNVGIGADVVSAKRKLFSVYIVGENLTDKAYQNHLSRLKYLAVNNATGRMGVFAMGRNISFKVIVPFGLNIKKKPATNN